MQESRFISPPVEVGVFSANFDKEMLLGDARNPVKNIIVERLRDWKTTKETIEKNMEKQLSAELEKIREENERRRMIVQELEGTIEWCEKRAAINQKTNTEH